MSDQTGTDVTRAMRESLQAGKQDEAPPPRPPAAVGQDTWLYRHRKGVIGWSIFSGLVVWMMVAGSNAPARKTDMQGNQLSRFIGSGSAIACNTTDLLELAVGYIKAGQTDKALLMIGPCTLFGGGQEVSVLDESVYSGQAHIRYFNPNRVYPEDFYTMREWLEDVVVPRN